VLELQVCEDEVFAFYRSPNAGPAIGGSLARVRPGGRFKGLSFDRLRALGTGRHEVEVDARARTERGQEPGSRSDRERAVADFHWALFGYTVGACTAEGVLDQARQVIRSEGVAAGRAPGEDAGDGRAD
jgi:hypothetical protein